MGVGKKFGDFHALQGIGIEIERRKNYTDENRNRAYFPIRRRSRTVRKNRL
jgi:hypothetical protein